MYGLGCQPPCRSPGECQNPYNHNPYNHNPYCVEILIGFVEILIGFVEILIGLLEILIGQFRDFDCRDYDCRDFDCRDFDIQQSNSILIPNNPTCPPNVWHKNQDRIKNVELCTHF